MDPTILLSAAIASGHIPDAWGRRMYDLMADISWRRQGKLLRQLERNIRYVIGEEASDRDLHAISQAAMRSYFRYIYESSILSASTAGQVPSPTSAIGYELIETNIRAGRGVILASPHMGNVQYAAVNLANAYGRVTTVTTQFLPGHRYDSFVKVRRELGIEILRLLDPGERSSPSIGPAHTFAILAQRLRAGGIVGLLADRPVSSGQIEVDFFDYRAHLASGPAMLALHTGAALLPTAVWYEDRGWSGQVYSEVRPSENYSRRRNISEMTHALGRVFEHAIKSHVQDWYMMREFFISDLGGQHRAPALPIKSATSRHPTFSRASLSG